MTVKNAAGRTVFLMMAATVLAKGLGVLRQMLIASHYGAGGAADAFNAAQALPLTMFDILLGAAIPGAFIPAYNRMMARDGEKRADEFADRFLNAVFVFTGALALLGIVFAPQLTELTASELDPQTKALSVRLLRIMFPMIIFTGGAYTLTGVMQSKGRFMLPALISSVSNAVIIIWLVFFNDRFGDMAVYGLAAASSVSWLAQVLILAVPLAVSGEKRFRVRPSLGLSDSELSPTLKSAPPVMVGAWLTPMMLLIGTRFSVIAAGDGGITVFSNAYHTYILITGILTYSICNYFFPELSRLSASSPDGEFITELRKGLKSALMISLPFTAAVWLLSPQGVSILYQRGQFTACDAESAAMTLRCLSVSMPAFTVVEVMSRAFYARRLGRIPMTAAIAGIAADLAVTAALVSSGAMSGVSAVAAGGAAAQLTAAAVLVGCSVGHMKGLYRGFAKSMLPAVAGTVLSAGVMFAVSRAMVSDPYADGALRNIVTCAAVFVPGAAVYLIFVLYDLRRKRREAEKSE
ncbi:MAG: murein biosynthesis integral membrane protein MurJ [Clostridiales bacterium]|nr:murein biosynthesis integral membrane protein MurJ [Clostridiales bacterium]